MAAGDIIHASDFAVLVKDSAPGAVKSGFTVASVIARVVGKVVHVHFDVVNTASITATGSDIPDTTVYTLSAAYAPTELQNLHWSSGGNAGDVQVNANGDVILRSSASVTVAASSNIRGSWTWIKD